MEVIFMAKNIWIICAVIALTVNISIAAEVSPITNAPPAPLFKDTSSGIEMVYVKGGCYKMGDIYYEENKSKPEFDIERDEERPVHEVCVDDFYMGKYEVTQGQWKSIMGSNTSALSTCSNENCPINNSTFAPR
jgi:formylglycine-generating enzyme required for sulfatase activity